MSTQQEAQQRAELFVFNNAESLYGHTQDFITTFIAGEASGERITLERLAAKSAEGFRSWWAYPQKRESLADKNQHDRYATCWQAGRAPLLAEIESLEKISTGWMNKYLAAGKRENNLKIKVTELELSLSGRSGFCEQCEVAQGKIAELESHSQYNSDWFTEAEKKITDLEAQNKQWENDFEKVNSMRIEQAETLIRKVGDLEAQNKKLGDVVLEMASQLRIDKELKIKEDPGAVIGFLSSHPIRKNADLIAQLKQERES